MATTKFEQCTHLLASIIALPDELQNARVHQALSSDSGLLKVAKDAAHMAKQLPSDSFAPRHVYRVVKKIIDWFTLDVAKEWFEANKEVCKGKDGHVSRMNRVDMLANVVSCLIVSDVCAQEWVWLVEWLKDASYHRSLGGTRIPLKRQESKDVTLRQLCTLAGEPPQPVEDTQGGEGDVNGVHEDQGTGSGGPSGSSQQMERLPLEPPGSSADAVRTERSDSGATIPEELPDASADV